MDQLESAARGCGAYAALALVGMELAGLARGWQRPKGRIVGRPVSVLATPGYFLLAAVYTWALFRLWRPLPLKLSRAARVVVMLLGTLLYGGGVGLTFAGRAALGEMYNVSTTQGAELYAGHRLVTSGPFALVRHPIYLGAALGSLGAVLLYRTWAVVFIALHVPVFFFRARREEEALAAEFGEDWRAYCRRVPSGLPGV